MKLSVIIVNYNVKHFLEQCLHSVQKACNDIDSEIFVVDNNSVDGSCNLVKDKFPEVLLIENNENHGFSYANNQAIKQAKGEYILLLNPDTVVEEDTLKKVTGFMDDTPDAGGLGVRMIDGKGNFLPESKRGLPTPWVAFYKIFGLSALFPHSKKFGRYHLTYLPDDEINQVDVLAGAFMLLRKSALEKVGLLDETFFMYGEDIDLSYRITQGGFKNYYFPETTIIHYKGESTKKGSVNYVRVFYKAMIIFAKKHFSHDKARAFSLLINIAIYFRALLAILNRLFSLIYLPVLDALVIFTGYLFLTPYWENQKFMPDYYPPEFLLFAVPVYILIWIGGIFISGGYKKPVKPWYIIRGLAWGTVVILLAYSLIDEKYRFSRALILLGAAWAVFSLPALRLLFNLARIKGFQFEDNNPKRIAIIGHPQEAGRVKELLLQTQILPEVVGYVSLADTDYAKEYIGAVEQIQEIIKINRIDELVFCAGNISSGKIIKAMLELSGLEVDFKIAPPESLSIIGSNSIHTAGDLYVINMNAISKPGNRVVKRCFDFTLGLMALTASPFIIWLYKNKKQFFRNVLKAVSGEISWVGYIPGPHSHDDLPALKEGILNPGELFPGIKLDATKKLQMNILYARNYSLLNDLEIILKALRNISRKTDA
ncbi:Glycosyl transferase, group 2 family [hydrothermal vent metagenome]|uniref:Glycosyl transferase, group 2 family n=1 Tax=hydrothermal vent metagenome TaxID=652676 RepID=A0A3B0TSW4_9ZZZZ